MAFSDFLNAMAAFEKSYPTIYEQYKNIPEILQLFVESGASGWTPDELQSKIQNTFYWKHTSKEQRDWDTLAATDPTEAQTRSLNAVQSLKNATAELGIKSPATGAAATWQFLYDLNMVTRNNFTQQQIKDYLLSRYSLTATPETTGQVLDNMNTARKTFSDYALPLSDQQALTYSKQMINGGLDQSGLNGYAAQQAQNLYSPEVGNAIKQGQTVRQWADPYIQLASNQLEIGADQIDLSQPKWQAMLKVPFNQAEASQALAAGKPLTRSPVSAGGENRAMTMAEWQNTIRTDPQYGFDTTSNARQSASQLASKIQQTFGTGQ